MDATVGAAPRGQESMTDFVAAMEKAGLLVRITDEKRVDELPMLMEQHYQKAVFVEKIEGSEFAFLGNAYSNHAQYAWALGCSRSEIGARTAELAKGRIKPKIVASAPCKQVILKDDQVDLTLLPMFLHHDRDGHAYTNDNLVVTKDPDTGITDWGIYRSMFRTVNEKNFDMTCTSHRARLNGLKYQARGQNMPVAIVIGGADAGQDRGPGGRAARDRRLRGAGQLLRRTGRAREVRDDRPAGARQRRDRARGGGDHHRGLGPRRGALRRVHRHVRRGHEAQSPRGRFTA